MRQNQVASKLSQQTLRPDGDVVELNLGSPVKYMSLSRLHVVLAF